MKYDYVFSRADLESYYFETEELQKLKRSYKSLIIFNIGLVVLLLAYFIVGFIIKGAYIFVDLSFIGFLSCTFISLVTLILINTIVIKNTTIEDDSVDEYTTLEFLDDVINITINECPSWINYKYITKLEENQKFIVMMDKCFNRIIIPKRIFIKDNDYQMLMDLLENKLRMKLAGNLTRR